MFYDLGACQRSIETQTDCICYSLFTINLLVQVKMLENDIYVPDGERNQTYLYHGGFILNKLCKCLTKVRETFCELQPKCQLNVKTHLPLIYLIVFSICECAHLDMAGSFFLIFLCFLSTVGRLLTSCFPNLRDSEQC